MSSRFVDFFDFKFSKFIFQIKKVETEEKNTVSFFIGKFIKSALDSLKLKSYQQVFKCQILRFRLKSKVALV